MEALRRPTEEEILKLRSEGGAGVRGGRLGGLGVSAGRVFSRRTSMGRGQRWKEHCLHESLEEARVATQGHGEGA